MGHLEITGSNELTLNSKVEIMSRVNHSDEFYKQAFRGKGIDITQLTLAEISAGIAAMKSIEADFLIWAAENLHSTPTEEIEAAVNSLINKGW